jgi:MSHA biogenesis protein MshN
MSVINRMLAELDARRAKAPASTPGDVVIVPAGVRANAGSRRLQVIVLLGAVAISAAAFGNWPGLIGAPGSQMPRPVGVAPNAGDPTPAAAAAAADAQALAPAPAASAAQATRAVADVAHAETAHVVAGPGLRTASVATATSRGVPRTEALPEVALPPPAPRLRPPELALPMHSGAVEKKLIAMTPAQRAALAYRQATEFAASGHSSQSIDKALEALKLDPEHHAARQLAAVLMFEKSRYDEAGDLLRDGLLRKPQQPQLAYLLARLQVETGDLAGALAVLAQAEGLSADGHGLRAGILAQLGRYAEALKSYEAAVRLDPDNASWWLGLGVALDAEGQTALAKQAFQRARAIGSLRADLLAYIDQKLAQ